MVTRNPEKAVPRVLETIITTELHLRASFKSIIIIIKNIIGTQVSLAFTPGYPLQPKPQTGKGAPRTPSVVPLRTKQYGEISSSNVLFPNLSNMLL